MRSCSFPSPLWENALLDRNRVPGREGHVVEPRWQDDVAALYSLVQMGSNVGDVAVEVEHREVVVENGVRVDRRAARPDPLADDDRVDLEPGNFAESRRADVLAAVVVVPLVVLLPGKPFG